MLVLLLAPNTHSISGQVRFDGDAPPVDVFSVGLCEVIADGTWCAYSVIPPAPKTTLNADGSFEITDVPHGDYGLVFDFGYSYQVMPWWPDESGEILFTVTDTSIDLGNLHYDDWPCELIPDWRCGTYLALPIVERSE